MNNEQVVNGRVYPLWNQFVENAQKWAGGTLEDHDMGMLMSTPIKTIELIPNGETSAFFQVIGEEFNCGFDVGYGGVVAGENGWITFNGYGGHTWRIKEK